jgi:FkbM family methyltransferase
MRVLGLRLLRGLNAILELLGLRPIRWRAGCDFPQVIALLKRQGFSPTTIFDIGVAYGTPELYQEFPDATYHLVEPVPGALRYMQRWARRLTATIHPVALGDTAGEAQMEMRADISKCTVYHEIAATQLLPPITVPVERFDARFIRPDLKPPVLVKIDVQGAELQVLRGMGGLLDVIDVFIVETSTIVTVAGGAAHLFDVVDHLRVHGYTLYDICGVGRRPLDGALAQLDLVFVKEASPLIADKRWAHG